LPGLGGGNRRGHRRLRLLQHLQPLPQEFHLLVRPVEPLASLATPLVHFVQPGVEIPQDRRALLHLSLSKPRFGRQFLHSLVQGQPGPLVLLDRRLDTPPHVCFHFPEPLLGEVPRTLVGFAERRDLSPQREDVAPDRQDILVGRTTRKYR
jgi:hypothetical protein